MFLIDPHKSRLDPVLLNAAKPLYRVMTSAQLDRASALFSCRAFAQGFGTALLDHKIAVGLSHPELGTQTQQRQQ